MDDETGESTGGSASSNDETVTAWLDYNMERFVRLVELAAAGIFALLFAVGVVDLGLQIGSSILSGEISDSRVIIGFIDTGLLLLIIVEVYETVVAHIRQSETRRIVRLIIYTGIIAMVRKVIIFRTTDYAAMDAALFAAVAYTIIILALAALLLVERFSDEA